MSVSILCSSNHVYITGRLSMSNFSNIILFSHIFPVVRNFLNEKIILVVPSSFVILSSVHL